MNRTLWQLILVLAFLTFGFLHAYDSSYFSAHALCPFGGLASLYPLLTEGVFVHRIHGSSLFLFAAVILAALLLGRVFCGWFCPLGAIGEWPRKLGKKIGLQQIDPTGLPDTLLKLLKYLLLALILYFVWFTGELFYRGWCPWSAFMTIFEPDELIEDVLFGGLILAAIVGLSMVIERFFCRYLCPLGAALAIFNRFSIVKPVREADCRGCKVCERVCPVNIKVASMEKINSGECIRCYRCVDGCPEGSSLTLKPGPLRPHHAGIAAVLVIALTIGISMHLGYWERGRVLASAGTGHSRGQESYIPAAEDDLEECEEEGGTVIEPAGAPVRQEGAGAIPPALEGITAMNTLEEAAHAAGLTLEEVREAWQLPPGQPGETTLREVMDKSGLSRRHLLERLTP